MSLPKGHTIEFVPVEQTRSSITFGGAPILTAPLAWIAQQVDPQDDKLVDSILSRARNHYVWKPISEPEPCSCLVCVPDDDGPLEPMDA